jgi:hypothetical protein
VTPPKQTQKPEPPVTPKSPEKVDRPLERKSSLSNITSTQKLARRSSLTNLQQQIQEQQQQLQQKSEPAPVARKPSLTKKSELRNSLQRKQSIIKEESAESSTVEATQTLAEQEEEMKLAAMFKKTPAKRTSKRLSKESKRNSAKRVSKEKVSLVIPKLKATAASSDEDSDDAQARFAYKPPQSNKSGYDSDDPESDASAEAQRRVDEALQAASNMQTLITRARSESIFNNDNSARGRSATSSSMQEIAFQDESFTNQQPDEDVFSPLRSRSDSHAAVYDPQEAKIRALQQAPTYTAAAGRKATVGALDFDPDTHVEGYDAPVDIEPFPARKATGESGYPARLQDIRESISERDSLPDTASTKTSYEPNAFSSKPGSIVSPRESVRSPPLKGREAALKAPTSQRGSLFGTISGFFRPTSPNPMPQSPPIRAATASPRVSRGPSLPQSPARKDSQSSLFAFPRLLRKPSASSVTSESSNDSNAEADLLLARLNAANRAIEQDPKALIKPDLVEGQEDIDWGTVVCVA